MKIIKNRAIIPLMLLMDVVILLCGIVSLLILLTGGGEIQLKQHLLRLYSIKNVLTFMVILAPLRYLISKSIPFLLVKKWNLAKLPQKTHAFLEYIYSKFNTPGMLEKKDITKILIWIICISTLIKLLNAWFYYGFYSGDDTEVVEMTLAKLFPFKWTAWNLRSAFYPMTFIYPIQYLLKSMSITDPRVLIFGGECVVIGFSILNIYFIYRITVKMFRNELIGIGAAFFLGFGQLHISFASIVLPRTVATAFILAAILLIIEKKESLTSVILAAGLFGVAAILRFSEAVFIVPFLVFFFLQKRIKHAVIFSIFSLLTGALLLGMSDYLYWGSPFYSLKNIFDYTLVQKLSSRGYQGPLYYFTHFWEWTNFFMVIPIIAAVKNWKNRWISLWAIIPILILSTLPHKEARYIIPTLPFWASLAALGMYAWLEKIIREGKKASTGPNHLSYREKALRSGLLLVFVFLASFLYEMDGYHFRKSEPAVDMALYLSRQDGIKQIAVELPWKAGGTIYLHKIPSIIDISDRINDTTYLLAIIKNPDLQYVALREESVSKFGLEPMLKENGFKAIDMGQQKKRDKYYLYVKE